MCVLTCPWCSAAQGACRGIAFLHKAVCLQRCRPATPHVSGCLLTSWYCSSQSTSGVARPVLCVLLETRGVKQQPSPGTAHSGLTSEARKSWSALRNSLCPSWFPASVLNCKISEDHSGYAKLICFWWESKHSFKIWKKTIWIGLYLTHDNGSCCVLWQCTLPMEGFLSLDACRHCVYRACQENGALFYCLL